MTNKDHLTLSERYSHVDESSQNYTGFFVPVSQTGQIALAPSDQHRSRVQILKRTSAITSQLMEPTSWSATTTTHARSDRSSTGRDHKLTYPHTLTKRRQPSDSYHGEQGLLSASSCVSSKRVDTNAAFATRLTTTPVSTLALCAPWDREDFSRLWPLGCCSNRTRPSLRALPGSNTLILKGHAAARTQRVPRIATGLVRASRTLRSQRYSYQKSRPPLDTFCEGSDRQSPP